MRTLALTVLICVILLSCSNRQGTSPDITIIDSTKNSLFIDRGQSSIVINTSGDTTKCYNIKSVDYKIAQLAPEGEWINFVVKRTSSTVTCDGQEGQKKTIKIELSPVDHPKHISYTFIHDSDELFLEHDYYQTVSYGCCDAEPIHKIYRYGGDLLLEGNERILIGGIPNNNLKFYVGYTPTKQDTSVIGSLNVVFDAEHKYEIKIKSSPLPPDLCSQYSPEISLISTYTGDTIELYENEYQLWELESIQSIEEIRNVAIHVAYQCEVYYPVEPLVIPISNGKPFGEDSIVQHVTLIHLLEKETTP